METAVQEDEARFMRMRGQLLSREGNSTLSVVDVVRHMVGLQAQELAAASLQARARSEGLVHADVTKALYEDRSIVRTWCLRGTLHLVTADDVRWLLALLGDKSILASRRRRNELGLDDASTERGGAILAKALRRHGPLSRPEVLEQLGAAGIPYEGQAGIHIVRTAALKGLVCYGPKRDGRETFVHLDDWIGGEAARGHPGDAATELARRYMGAYGPASHADFAWWCGLGAASAKAAIEVLAPELATIDVAGKPAWALSSSLVDKRAFPRAKTVVNLLPAFDPYLLGYKARSLALAPADIRQVNAGGGLLKPVVVANGQVVATWSTTKRRALVEVLVEPLGRMSQDVLEGLRSEAADLSRYLGAEHTLNIKE